HARSQVGPGEGTPAPIPHIEEGTDADRDRYVVRRQVPRIRRIDRRRDDVRHVDRELDRKSTRLNSSHVSISYAVFCLKKKHLIPSRPTVCRPKTRPGSAASPLARTESMPGGDSSCSR